MTDEMFTIIEALRVINKCASPGHRTLDEISRDMDAIASMARSAMNTAQELADKKLGKRIFELEEALIDIRDILERSELAGMNTGDKLFDLIAKALQFAQPRATVTQGTGEVPLPRAWAGEDPNNPEIHT